MSDKKPTTDLGLQEEDNNFEEFPFEDWKGLGEDVQVW